jgi:hypothetical protein
MVNRRQNIGIDELLTTERDIFRLAIRGHALLEDALDTGISEAFQGDPPPELGRQFRLRMALFAALAPLTPELVTAVHAVAAVRNEFAHGRINDLLRERAKALAQDVRPVIPESDIVEFIDSEDPLTVFAASLVIAYSGIEAGTMLIRERRNRQQQALTVQSAPPGGRHP